MTPISFGKGVKTIAKAVSKNPEAAAAAAPAVLVAAAGYGVYKFTKWLLSDEPQNPPKPKP